MVLSWGASNAGLSWDCQLGKIHMTFHVVWAFSDSMVISGWLRSLHDSLRLQEQVFQEHKADAVWPFMT